MKRILFFLLIAISAITSNAEVNRSQMFTPVRGVKGVERVFIGPSMLSRTTVSQMQSLGSLSGCIEKIKSIEIIEAASPEASEEVEKYFSGIIGEYHFDVLMENTINDDKGVEENYIYIHYTDKGCTRADQVVVWSRDNTSLSAINIYADFDISKQ